MLVNAAFLFFVLSSIFSFFSHPEVDNDLWGHLFFGREILEGGRLPQQNLYSYTAPDHRWINHEWLAEVIFYGIFRLSGSPGLILFKVALGAVIVWVLDLILRRRSASPLVRALALVWGMAILSPGFHIRPQLFTYLFFAIFLFLFCRYERGSRTSLYWIPFWMVLWVNLHGGFLAGLGAFGLFSIWTVLIKGRQSRKMSEPIVTCGIPLILSILFVVLNPYGLSLLGFLARDLLLDRPITEWQATRLFDFSFLEFKLSVLFVLLFFARKDSLRQWDFILSAWTAVFAFRHQRHIPLFAIVAAPFLAVGIQKVHHWVRTSTREWILAVAVFGVAIYQISWVGSMHWQHRFRLVVSPEEYPTQAVDFLQRNGARGNLAVPFDWGEYLIWRLYPEVRVSIDGRYTTAYPMQVIRENWEWMGGGKEWSRLLERYPTEIALTKRDHPVTALIRNDPEWVYVYSDPIAFVFVRKTPSQQQLLDKFREKRLHPPESPPIYFPG